MQDAVHDLDAPRKRNDRIPAPANDCRCDCGSLLARLVAGAVEVKCRRCKRVVHIHLPAAAHAPDASVRTGEALRVTTVASTG